MGYLSQKKRSEREKFFLRTMRFFIGVYSILLFFTFTKISAFSFLKEYLFQFYVITLAVTVYAFILKKWISVLFFTVCLLVQFFHLSAFANIFFNKGIEEGQAFELVYGGDKKSVLQVADGQILRSGHLNLHTKAPSTFKTITIGEKNITVVDIDFAHLSASERRLAFKKLKIFVSKQDTPVILVGNFGETPWSHHFKRFISQTGLQVKNRMLLADCKNFFNPLAVPDFYILSFGNVGIEHISLEMRKNGFCTKIKADMKIH